MSTARGRFRGWRGKLLAACVPLVALLLLEIALRIFTAAPKGQFVTWFPGRKGLYPENADVVMTWGVIPYRMHINSLGLRGPEPSGDRDTVLIACIGDSYTDGFFVDDADTYPVGLQRELQVRGLKADVLNAARAGGSIDKELAILREVVLPLKPKVVILQFCTNDIFELVGKTTEELQSYRLVPPFRLHREAARWVLTRTALGEVAYASWLRASRKHYGEALATVSSGAERYQIEGGTHHAANAQLFMQRFGQSDGLLLAREWTKETEKAVESYLVMLEQFKAECDRSNASLIYLYEPAYPQVYEPESSLQIRDQLKSACERLGVSFVDLTPAMVSAGPADVFHLAPADFHLNPQGNRLTARILSPAVLERLGAALDSPKP